MIRHSLDDLSGTLTELLSGTKPIAIFDNFYSSREVESILANIPDERILWFPEHQLGRIGFSIKEVQEDRCEVSPEMYFAKAQEMHEVFDSIFTNIENPISKLAKLLTETGYTYGIANDPEYQKMYNYGVLEYQKCGRKLHVDNFADKGLNLSFVVNLGLPDSDGELVLYDCQHNAEDGYTDQKVIYSEFAHQITCDKRKIVLAPRVGQAYLFNNRYYHLVKKSKGEHYRISFLSILKQLNPTSFVGYV